MKTLNTSTLAGQKRNACIALAALALAMLSGPAMASAGGAGSLPWEGPLSVLASSITGPVAFVVSLLAIVGAGCTLAFGGDMNGFIRTILIIVLIISVIVGAANIMSGVWGKGAELTAYITSIRTAA